MNYCVTDTQLTSIANAIRSKAGISGQLSFPSDFVSEIGDIERYASTTIDKTERTLRVKVDLYFPVVIPARSGRIVGQVRMTTPETNGILQIKGTELDPSVSGLTAVAEVMNDDNDPSYVNLGVVNETDQDITISSTTYINLNYWTYEIQVHTV